ncbi:MAG: cupin domain-containing protein [Acidobacteriota bacterium]
MQAETSGALVSAPGIVRAGESVTGEPIRFVGKETFVKLAAGDGGMPVSILEDVSPAHHGPPLHVHDFEEFFYVLTGEFLFEVDGVQFRVGPGDFAHGPAGVPHVFQNITDQPAKMLIVVRPGGIEKYFTELAACAMTDPGNVAALNAIAPRYGIQILGPPLAARTKHA